MIELPFGFSVQEDTPLEIGMLSDLKVLVKYVKIYKNQSLTIYAKLNLDNKVTEIYPYFINNDIILSLQELDKEIPYLDTDIKNNQLYISYDMKNCPNEIYIPYPEINELYKFKLDKQDAKYYIYYSIDDFKKSKYYSEFNFTKKFPDPDYIMVQEKNGFHAFALGYLPTNKKYKKIKRKYFKNVFNKKRPLN